MSVNGHPPALDPEATISVLAVSTFEQDRAALAQIFGELRWKLCVSASLQEADAHLVRGVFPVVLCQASLPDGNWKFLFQRAEGLVPPPSFIVVARLADERLWCEVLNLGGYDVLSTPFDRSEVSHVVRCAWDASRREGRRKVNGALRRNGGASGRDVLAASGGQ